MSPLTGPGFGLVTSLGVGLIAGAQGCGEVIFVDPDADLKRALSFAQADRLIVDGDPRGYFFVRVTTSQRASELRFWVQGNEGRFQIPAEAALPVSCGQDSCFAITMGPGLPENLSAFGLSLPSIGHEAQAPLLTNRTSGYVLSASAKDRNTQVQVSVSDPVSMWNPSFPRRFEAFSQADACAQLPDDPPWQAVTNPPEIPALFSEGPRPLSCITIRPDRPALGAPVVRQTIPARALTTRFRHVFVPPRTQAPLVYRMLFDLELPNQARCQDAQSVVRASFRQGAEDIAETSGEGLGILEIEPVQIARVEDELCRQTNDRSFSAPAVVDSTKAALSALGAEQARVVFVYAANLEAEPPSAITDAFFALRELVRRDPELSAFVLAVAPNRAQSGIEIDLSLPWIGADVPAFRSTLRAALQSVWPFQTLLHSPETVVPLVEQSELNRFQAFRICSLDPQVQVVGSQLTDTAWSPGPVGPAYQVFLQPQRLVPASEFLAPRVVVTWEGCERLCDLPAEGGDSRIPWLDLFDC